MIYEDLHIHGGIVDEVKCQGNVIMHGGVVEHIDVKGDFKQFGGVIESEVNEKPKVIYRDRVIYKDKVVIKNNSQQTAMIVKLQKENKQLQDTIKQLREDAEKKEKEEPSDDVLVMRIESLELQIEKERKDRQKEIDDLQFNLEGVKEAYFDLLHKQKEQENKNQQIVDDHIDILATMLALYPFTPDKDIEFEFGIPSAKISMVAKILGVIKSTEARREAKEYLEKQNRTLIDRRGGKQGNQCTKTIVKVAKNGKVLATYKSAADAAKRTGFCIKTIQTYCRSKEQKYTNEGFTFRYK